MVSKLRQLPVAWAIPPRKEAHDGGTLTSLVGSKRSQRQFVLTFRPLAMRRFPRLSANCREKKQRESSSPSAGNFFMFQPTTSLISLAPLRTPPGPRLLLAPHSANEEEVAQALSLAAAGCRCWACRTRNFTVPGGALDDRHQQPCNANLGTTFEDDLPRNDHAPASTTQPHSIVSPSRHHGGQILLLSYNILSQVSWVAWLPEALNMGHR